jgi:hypothetical protein
MSSHAGRVLDVVPKLHERLVEAREIAGRLAAALEAEVDLAYGLRHDAERVHAKTGRALKAAREAGLL